MKKRHIVALLAAAILSIPAISYCFQPSRDVLASKHLELALSDANPEFDLMRRMFTVLAFANRATAGHDRQAALSYIDKVIADTMKPRDDHHFLLGYSRNKPFEYEQGRSLFVDGEKLMMLAARQMIEPKPEPRLMPLARRVAQQIADGPILCGESYPDECWTFCNTTALAALAITDKVTGSDHSGLMKRWVASAKKHLIDDATGLLISSYTWRGERLDGPEGSTIWMSAHNLRLIDPAFARDQYQRAVKELAIDVVGYGMAREWPRSAMGLPDIDSGLVIPGLGAGEASSGLALIAARSFGDKSYFDALVRSLGLAGALAPAMGDAVIFYAFEDGPL